MLKSIGLNGDDRINGILVQLPLPKHIEEKAIIERISPEKDVDGFHPISVGRMMTGQDTFLPCTPHGIVELVKETNLDISGKHVVVIEEVILSVNQWGNCFK